MERAVVVQEVQLEEIQEQIVQVQPTLEAVEEVEALDLDLKVVLVDQVL